MIFMIILQNKVSYAEGNEESKSSGSNYYR